jgi:transcriptional regulator with XRE-family HTH domain
MNQKKTGLFLKQLRKAQNMTQEQVAEKIGVSSRTISRWETGEYMPDISILVDIAEMYEVDVREIIDGERMNDNLNSEVKEVAEKMADYSKMEKTVMLKWIKTLSVAMLAVSICGIISNLITAFLMIKSQPGANMLPQMLIKIIFNENYIILVLSTLSLLYSTGKIGQIEHSHKASIIVKATVVLAIIMSVFSIVQVIGLAGVSYGL